MMGSEKQSLEPKNLRVVWDKFIHHVTEIFFVKYYEFVYVQPNVINDFNIHRNAITVVLYTTVTSRQGSALFVLWGSATPPSM
jgi:hypothetical protein